MKFGPRDLRFTYPVWASFRGVVVFIGRRNTLHLQETALVIEGYLQRFFFFVIIDRFFRMALSEWTTVTVPSYVPVIDGTSTFSLIREMIIILRLIRWVSASASSYWHRGLLQ